MCTRKLIAEKTIQNLDYSFVTDYTQAEVQNLYTIRKINNGQVAPVKIIHNLVI